MANKEVASVMVQCQWIESGPVAYELWSGTCDIVFDQSGNPSVQTASVTPFRIDGTSRTQIAVNATGSEFVVILRKWRTDGTEANPEKAAGAFAMSLQSMKTARFDLLPAAAVSSSLTYQNSSILASRQVNIIRDGLNGNGSFTSTVFRRATSKPAKPSGGTYGNPVPTTSGWSDAPASGTDPIWMSTARFTSEMTGASGAPTPTWTDPVPATDSTDLEFIWSTAADPALPSEHPFNASSGGDWSKDATGAVWMATAVKSNGVWGDWVKVRVKGEKGDKGDKGDDAVMYRLSLSPSQLTYDLNAQSYDASSVTASVSKIVGKTETAVSSLSSEGLTLGYIRYNSQGQAVDSSPVTYSGAIVFATARYSRLDFSLKKGNLVVASQTLSIVTSGQNGVNGKNGVWVPPPMLWSDYEVGYKFMSGNLSANPIETRLDITIIIADNGKLWPYRCKSTYVKASTSLPPDKDTTHWERCDAGVYKFLATELLLAANARISFLSGQAIRVGDASGMCGYFGAPVGESGAILYTGGDNVSDATYVVYANGRARWGNASGKRIELDPIAGRMLVYGADGALCAIHSGDDLDYTKVGSETGNATDTVASTGLGKSLTGAATAYTNLVTGKTAGGNGTVKVSVPAFNVSASGSGYPESGTGQAMSMYTAELALEILIDGKVSATYQLGATDKPSESLNTTVRTVSVSIGRGSTYTVRLRYASCLNATGSASFMPKGSATVSLEVQNKVCHYGRNGYYVSTSNQNYSYCIYDSSGKMHQKTMVNGTAMFDTDDPTKHF